MQEVAGVIKFITFLKNRHKIICSKVAKPKRKSPLAKHISRNKTLAVKSQVKVNLSPVLLKHIQIRLSLDRNTGPRPHSNGTCESGTNTTTNIWACASFKQMLKQVEK